MVLLWKIPRRIGTRKDRKFQAEWLKKEPTSSEEQKTKLEVEILSNSALDENRAGRVTEGKGKRGCRVESTLVE